jgi:hypothetical protein
MAIGYAKALREYIKREDKWRCESVYPHKNMDHLNS